MTYKELYDDAIWQLESGKITVGEFDKRVEPLNAEVRKKGKWIRETFEDWWCNQCGNEICTETPENYYYCPNCGADMRGDKECGTK